MGNSSVKLQSVIDHITARGIPSPLANPSGYGMSLALDLATDVMSDLIAERFNWKWNSKLAAPFYTNSWQQDYPQVGLKDVSWLEDADRVDINNTAIPKPLENMTVRRGLSSTNFTTNPIDQLAWHYNKDLSYGAWPGPGITYSPLIGTTPTAQNPLMSMIDINGNLLIVTGFGTTGLSAPVLSASSPEGTTVIDGTVTWTVVSPDGQGWRVYPLPGATGPVYQVIPKYQVIAPIFTDPDQLLNPIPDDYARHFRVGYALQCKGASPNPADKADFKTNYPIWLKALEDIKKQGDKESDAYGLYPATYPVDSIYPFLRNPQDPSQPF